MRAATLFALLIAAVCILRQAGLVAQEQERADPKTLREFMDLATKWYEVYPDADAKESAQVVVALRWANNARGSEDGMTLLFIHEGRPLAVACVYPWAKRLEHDFESLSRGKIVAKRDGAVVWQPQQAGVAFADLPGAPVPEAAKAQRLRQMKSLAEKFRATMLGWKADSTDREELRLLNRPLYRYEPKDGSDIIDGAVFAFVMGTDPEVILLLEAVKDKDKAKWQYAFARRTSGELEARLGEAVIWKAARFPPQNDARQPHFTRGTPLPPSIAAEIVEEEKAK
jgi:hypothetical protein